MLETELIDDFSDPERAAGTAAGGRRWRFLSDRVMGGRSTGRANFIQVDERSVLKMTGTVSLENNGGFVQVALDLGLENRTGASTLNAAKYKGISITARGDGRHYGVHLRTTDTRRPWQSYRSRFLSTANWEQCLLPFTDFTAHRIDRPFDLSGLRRLGVIAIGEPGDVTLFIDELAFYA